MDYQHFKDEVWQYYRAHGRRLPWRQPQADGSFDAYKILVSEIMLQQTQVNRVKEKYEQFLNAFPTLPQLAQAKLADVLIIWNGLGYNRRAKYIWQTAQQLLVRPQPWCYEDLIACPGIGPNTAAAILVYAYNLPHIFVETNIRTAYIHHFLPAAREVSDQTILDLVERTYDRHQPREFFWALMDYGSHLKSTAGNSSRQSKHYTRQDTFTGSRRQLRGAVLRHLTSGPKTTDQLARLVPDSRLKKIVADLAREGLLRHDGQQLNLA